MQSMTMYVVICEIYGIILAYLTIIDLGFLMIFFKT